MIKSKSSTHYVDKQEFLKAVSEYKKVCRIAKKEKKPKPRITNYLGTCIMLIARNLSNNPKFFKYTYKDEMVEDAIENCIMYFDNFDPKHAKKNPFGYFTKICWYAFVRRIQKEKKQQYTKYKIAQQFGLNEIFEGENEDGSPRKIELYENLSEFITKYEESKNKKTKIVPEKKVKLEEFMEE